MIGYGMAKAAIHQLTKSLASSNSGLPSDAKTFALLPITLGKNECCNCRWMCRNKINKRRILSHFVLSYTLILFHSFAT